jgi:hypothetical protein
MTMQRVWRPAALQLAAGLGLIALAACGGSPAASSAGGSGTSAGDSGAASPAATQAAAAKPVNVCSMLTAKQASALVGVTYTKATPSGGSMCSYASTTAPIPMFIIVSSGSGAAAWTEALGTLKEDGGDTPRTFSGVGDRAAGDGTQFDVQSGGWIVDVHGGDPSGNGSSFPKSTAVAKALISALNAA